MRTRSSTTCSPQLILRLNSIRKGMKQHETRVLGFTREQLGNGIGVNADSSLFNLQRVDLHGTSAPLGTQLWLCSRPQRQSARARRHPDGCKGGFYGPDDWGGAPFHALTVPGKNKMGSIHVHQTEAAKLQGTQTALRRAARWRKFSADD